MNYLDDEDVDVFPVYAGVILIKNIISIIQFSVPRVCGGDP